MMTRALWDVWSWQDGLLQNKNLKHSGQLLTGGVNPDGFAPLCTWEETKCFWMNGLFGRKKWDADNAVLRMQLRIVTIRVIKTGGE